MHLGLSISILLHNRRRKQIWSLQFITFKRNNDVTPSSAMNDVIFQLQMTSAITHFPCASKAVKYCLIYYTIFALALQARRVRTLVCKCWMMTLMNNIYNSKRVVLSRSALFLLNAWLSQNLDISSVFFSRCNDSCTSLSKCYIIKQLLTNEALDMMWYRPDNTNIDIGFASVNIGILWSISHHIQCLISQ